LLTGQLSVAEVTGLGLAISGDARLLQRVLPPALATDRAG
jgi:hypothetical protein